jgi:hypothetical protein
MFRVAWGVRENRDGVERVGRLLEHLLQGQEDTVASVCLAEGLPTLLDQIGDGRNLAIGMFMPVMVRSEVSAHHGQTNLLPFA